MAPFAPLVLISRPTAQAREFQQLLGPGAECIISPVLNIESINTTIDFNDYGALVFTSRNAVTAANRLGRLEGRKAYAVGERTAELASKFGMKVTHSNGGSPELVRYIVKTNDGGNLLFLRGEYSRGDIVGALKLHGIRADQAVIYRQVRQPLTESAKIALCGSKPVIIPLFSPRSAKYLGEETGLIDADMRLCLIGFSQSVADAWEGPAIERTEVLSRPTLAGMVERTLKLIDAYT